MTRGLDALRCYRPLPAVRPFHQCPAKWRILDGANRSGKTLAGAVEVAAAVLGYREIVSPGAPYKPENGRAQVIGLSMAHLGAVWRKLSRPGAFFCIYDPETSELRAVRISEDDPRELDPRDLELRDKWVEAPPLIPKHCIRDISWHDKVKQIPDTVRLVTGWEISFVPSMGRVRQGEHYDLGWIDEAIQNDEHYYELCRGIVDFGQSTYRSRAFWTATPRR